MTPSRLTPCILVLPLVNQRAHFTRDMRGSSTQRENLSSKLWTIGSRGGGEKGLKEACCNHDPAERTISQVRGDEDHVQWLTDFIHLMK